MRDKQSREEESSMCQREETRGKRKGKRRKAQARGNAFHTANRQPSLSHIVEELCHINPIEEQFFTSREDEWACTMPPCFVCYPLSTQGPGCLNQVQTDLRSCVPPLIINQDRQEEAMALHKSVHLSHNKSFFLMLVKHEQNTQFQYRAIWFEMESMGTMLNSFLHRQEVEQCLGL